MQLSGDLNIVGERPRDCHDAALAPATLSVPEARVYSIPYGEIWLATLFATLPLLRLHLILDLDSKVRSKAV